LSPQLLQQLVAGAIAPPAGGLPTKRIFRSREEVQACVDAAPRTVAPWAGEEGPRWRITVSPGSIQVGTRDYARLAATAERATQRALRDNVDMTLLAETETPSAAPKRGRITAWTAQSRAGMVRRLCTLDYLPLFAGEHAPALVTLTMPHDWVTVAPTAADFKKLVERWRSKWTRKWGAAPVAVWKMEFQYRVACAEAGCHDPRAPHLHLLMRLPDVPLAEFQAWLSQAWCDAVRHPDPAERAKHLAAGTAVDFEETMRYGDAKRVAVYFTKHGTFASKDYQNELPAVWVESGGRFWGYWGLEPAEGVLETDPDLAAFAARVLRHVHDAQRYGDPIAGAELEFDPHRRRALGRSRDVWRSKPLPAEFAAVVASLDPEVIEQTGETPISAIMSARRNQTS